MKVKKSTGKRSYVKFGLLMFAIWTIHQLSKPAPDPISHVESPSSLGDLKSRETQSVQKLPNVLVIGAQKGGTTALAGWLRDSGYFCIPKVFQGEPHYFAKEVSFFNHDHRYEQGVEFYAKRFNHCNDEEYPFQIDATPHVIKYPERVWST